MPLNAHGELLAESPIAVAEVMLSRAQAAIEACPTSEPLSESYVVLGELAWDECCGILAAAPLRTFRTATFPVPVADATNCDDALLAVDVAVILLRCAPGADGVPTPEQMATSFTSTSNDAAVIWNALASLDLPEGWERANIEQTFIGADGACIAIDTRVTIGLPQTDWCACPEVP